MRSIRLEAWDARRIGLPAMAWAACGCCVKRSNLVDIGAQSYSFRKFDVSGSIEQLRRLGLHVMEFCAVHFPADASDVGFAVVRDAIAAAGVRVPCFGVEGFSADETANRKKFEFAKALGVEVLTADPTPDSFASLDTLCDEFGIRVGIHNHGPGARYDKVKDTLRALEGHSPLIGACVDTGHSIRSGEKPEEAIEALGERAISLHLKDWIFGGEEQILGEGDLSLVKVVRVLKSMCFAGPIVMEYENSPQNPTPEMQLGLANWRRAVEQA